MPLLPRPLLTLNPLQPIRCGSSSRWPQILWIVVFIVVEEDAGLLVGDDLRELFGEAATGPEVVDEAERPGEEDTGAAYYAGDFRRLWVGASCYM